MHFCPSIYQQYHVDVKNLFFLGAGQFMLIYITEHALKNFGNLDKRKFLRIFFPYVSMKMCQTDAYMGIFHNTESVKSQNIKIFKQGTVKILCIGTDRSQQTVQTKIRLLLKKQSDQGLRCWPLHQILLCNVTSNFTNFRTLMAIV